MSNTGWVPDEEQRQQTGWQPDQDLKTGAGMEHPYAPIKEPPLSEDTKQYLATAPARDAFEAKRSGPSPAEEVVSDIRSGNYSRAGHRALTTFGEAAAPLAVPALAAAPIATLAGMGAGAVAQYGTKKAAPYVGASPDQADLAGDIAGLTAGGLTGSRFMPKEVPMPGKGDFVPMTESPYYNQNKQAAALAAKESEAVPLVQSPYATQNRAAQRFNEGRPGPNNLISQSPNRPQIQSKGEPFVPSIDKVLHVPEPTQPAVGGEQWSNPRAQLKPLGLRGNEGAQTVMQRLGQPMIVIPKEAGYPGPRQAGYEPVLPEMEERQPGVFSTQQYPPAESNVRTQAIPPDVRDDILDRTNRRIQAKGDIQRSDKFAAENLANEPIGNAWIDRDGKLIGQGEEHSVALDPDLDPDDPDMEFKRQKTIKDGLDKGLARINVQRNEINIEINSPLSEEQRSFLGSQSKNKKIIYDIEGKSGEANTIGEFLRAHDAAFKEREFKF